MATRTLTSTWNQYEKLARSFLAGKKEPASIHVSLSNNAQKANSAKIGSAIAKLFLKDYPGYEDAKVIFYVHNPELESEYPTWLTSYDLEKHILCINPLAIFLFIEDCKTVEANLEKREIRRSFHKYRYFAFLSEIKKLPSKVLMFLLILQRIALTNKIADVETKGGIIEAADGEDYLTLLWAFKELENFMQNTSGVNLRSEYKVSWYESDWSTGV